MLLTKSLVEKSEAGYALSESGRRFVADIHHTSDQANRLFKINAITIVSRIVDGEIQILTQKRHSQPSFGLVGVMGGTILKGESITEGAARKLQQEAGLQASFKVVGMERRRLYSQGELFSDVLFPICYAENSEGELKTETEFGYNYWEGIDQAIRNDSRPFDSIQAIPKVLNAVKSGTIHNLPIFFDETTQKED
jgi:8-oxo-dGTP pyrophosphatase MutT (NUDIX family)